MGPCCDLSSIRLRIGDGYSCAMHNSALSQYVNLAGFTSRFIIWPLGVTTALTAADNCPFKVERCLYKVVVSDSIWRLLEQECIPVGCVPSGAVAVSLVDRILDTLVKTLPFRNYCCGR